MHQLKAIASVRFWLLPFFFYELFFYSIRNSSNTFLSPSVPSQPPPNTVVKSTSTSTIDVSWEPINQAYVHGVLLGYEVRYAKDDGSSPPTWETVTLDAGTNEVVLSDLEYFTPYKVMVCARTSKGCGEEYSDIAYTFGDGE